MTNGATLRKAVGPRTGRCHVLSARRTVQKHIYRVKNAQMSALHVLGGEWGGGGMNASRQAFCRS